MKSVIIHYGEIALKGKNRPWFVARLVKNLRAATSDLDIAEVRVLMGRIELVLGPGTSWEQVRDRVSLVFGIGNFARAGRSALDVDVIAAEIQVQVQQPTAASVVRRLCRCGESQRRHEQRRQQHHD
jgi:thiamine biosynthesis protein ThiI